MQVHFAHLSMQFDDTNAQHTHDLEKVFGQGFDVITGTEAGFGAGNTASEVKRIASDTNYRFKIVDKYDTWVAVKGSLVVKDSVVTGADHVIGGSASMTPKPPGTWGQKAIVWLQFTNKDLGQIAVGAVHTLTAKNAGTDLKIKSDRMFADDMKAWAKKHGAGASLAFIGGDFNNNDQTMDFFQGGPMTTCWDELKLYPPTSGRRTIDAIASYDFDTRVKCLSARTYTDTAFFLNTDHLLISAVYEIKPIVK